MARCRSGEEGERERGCVCVARCGPHGQREKPGFCRHGTRFYVRHRTPPPPPVWALRENAARVDLTSDPPGSIE
jgi:hypothetical protein